MYKLGGFFFRRNYCSCTLVSEQLTVKWFLHLSLTLQSYVSDHPSIVLLDPLPAMTQLLDRFASYRIMTKLHNSLRGELQCHSVYCGWLFTLWVLTTAFAITFCPTDWRICSPPYLEVHSASDLSSIQQAVMTQGLSFPLSQFTLCSSVASQVLTCWMQIFF